MQAFSIKLPAVSLLLLIWLLPACSLNQSASSDVIAWQSYEQGLQAASSQGKKTFLYFRADW